MQLRFRTSAIIATVGVIGQANAINLAVESELNAAASSSSQPGTLQHGEATLAQVGNVNYHEIQGLSGLAQILNEATADAESETQATLEPKSTLALALTRIIELSGGYILIDGHDISQIDLN